MKYFIELGGTVSQFFNVLILGGEANYSISSDAYRLGRVRTEKFINFLLGDTHCYDAYMTDVRKAEDLLKHHKET